MRYLMVMITIIASFSYAQNLKSQKFVDIVYEIKDVKEKSFVSFHRTPTIYEIDGEKGEPAKLLEKLNRSKKSNKAIEVTVDPVSRTILEVKSP